MYKEPCWQKQVRMVAMMGDGSVSGLMAWTFGRDGFLEPFQLFTAGGCRVIASHFRQTQYPSDKSIAIVDRFVCNLATHPRLLSLIAKLIGENIVLWGAQLVIRAPGDIHPWHTDIESSAPEGRFASVWIGLEHTCRESALQLIQGSHALGKTLQQVQHERGFRRGAASDHMIARWARNLDANARLVQLEMTDGDALVFDGRLWHVGPNRRSHGTRIALLLQYAAAATPVPVPDLAQLEWPFRFKHTRASVILVRGEARKDVNELVRLPPAITSQVCHLALPLADDPERRWKPYGMLKGATPVVEEMSCHVSVLSPGFTPHPPHSHSEEELLIALQGEAELIISDSPSTEHGRTERLSPGSLIYYPAGQHHTIRNTGVSPITYLMFKWRGGVLTGDTPAGTRTFHFRTVPTDNSKSFQACPIFEQSTAYLGKLHAHLTTMQPGAGYPPHIDDYDVAILVLSGQVETLGQFVKPHGVIYYPAGQPHGLRNVGDEPAQYLVFEFHAPKTTSSTRNRPHKAKTARQRLADMLSHLGLLEAARRARNMFRQPK